MTKYVYLAGPIEGCDQKEINHWRNHVEMMFTLRSDYIRGVSPYRAQEAVYKGEPDFAQAIFDKNWYDCQKCDAILAYLPKEINDRRPSIGTLFEIAWFISMRKPVFIISDDPVYTNHPLISTNTGWINADIKDFETTVHDITNLLIYRS